MFKSILTVVVIAGVALLVWSSFDAQPSDQGAYAWVAIEPVQCNGNPWQGETATEAGFAEESDIIKRYYASQGIEVMRVERRETSEFVCRACTCPRGDTLYLSVAQDDVSAMRALGFREMQPPLE